MASPQHHFQNHYQQPHHQHQQQQQQSKNFRNIYAIDSQISLPADYYNTAILEDQSQHPPYIPPFSCCWVRAWPKVENINKRNMELEEKMEELTVEAGAWQQRARCNENMISALKFNLHQVYAQSRDSKEGCGDS
ncbi:hypothetical protein QYF36_019000 [Acer negundo]|nr:hypothetical protein QYF36_019000 [Acer negundo]